MPREFQKMALAVLIFSEGFGKFQSRICRAEVERAIYFVKKKPQKLFHDLEGLLLLLAKNPQDFETFRRPRVKVELGKNKFAV